MLSKLWGMLFALCAVLMSGCVTMGYGTESAVLRAKNKVAPALVHIRPVKEVFSRGQREEVTLVGSGFIISDDGYVVTNEHVAGNATLVRCILSDKEEIDADVVGTDPYTDIAVLKLKTDRQDLPFVRMGHSDTLQAGQTVLALGSPHGLTRSVSLGIVSVTDRYLSEHGTMVSPYNNFIQTDAAINPGNSGGPLVNLRGEVVGINSRTLMGAENVGFAIPVDIARQVVNSLIATGRVERAWLGVNLQETMRVTEDPSVRGVIIGDVDPLGPAYEAGLVPGDRLTAVNGVPLHARFVEDLPHVRQLLAGLPLDQDSAFQVTRRDGSDTVIMIRPVEKGALLGDEVEFKEWGFTVRAVTDAVARNAQLPSRTGVLVSGVQVGGYAANAGLVAGDILLSMDNTPIPDLETFDTLYNERLASKQTLILFDVKSGAVTRFVVLKQNGERGDDDEN